MINDNDNDLYEYEYNVEKNGSREIGRYETCLCRPIAYSYA